MKYIGIDGAKDGWVLAEIKNKKLTISFISQLEELSLSEEAVILIDIPIKLPLHYKDYPRKKDIAAKGVLKKRHSCIFYAPIKKWLPLPYSEINKLCDTYKKPKLSKQSFFLFKKIAEAQAFQTKYKTSLVEHHPELIFLYFNQNTPLKSKHSKDGLLQRHCIIQSLLQKYDISSDYKTPINLEISCSEDDQLDAIILALFYYEMSQKEEREFLYFFS